MKKTSYILGAICLAAVLFGVGMATGKGIEVQAEDTVVLGDLNNSTVADKEDAIVLEKHLTGETEITGENVLDAADTNGDGTVNVKDLVRYRRYCTEATDALSQSGNTYYVNTLSDLLCLTRMVNNKEFNANIANQFAGKTIQLTMDLVVNPGAISNVENGTLVAEPSNELLINMTPIGIGGQFAGNFCGYDSETDIESIRTISGVYICTSESVATGLFANIGGSGTVNNLKMTNSYICNTSSAGQVGSVAGQFNSSGNVTNIYSDAVVVCESGQRCGGLFGNIGGTSERTISNCMFAGYAKGSEKCGGITGAVRFDSLKNFQGCLNKGAVVSCSTSNSTLSYVGGIVGAVERTGNATNGYVFPSISVEQCFNVGTLTATTTNASKLLGGMIGGVVDTDVTTDDTITVKDCYVVEAEGMLLTNSSNVASVTTSITDSHMYPEIFLKGWDGYRLTTLDFTSENAYWTAVVDGIPELTTWTDASDKIAIASNAARASFDWKETYDSTTKTYSIDSVEDLYGVEADSRLGINNVKNGEYTRNGFGSATLKLEDNIIFNTDINNPVNEWNPIGDNTQQFYGTFDGNNKEILGLYIKTAQQRVGLFGQCHANSTIQNVVIKDGRIISTFSGEAYVGSVVGFAQGTVENVYSNAIIECSGSECGGIIGRFGGDSEKTISKCWFDGEVSSLSNYCGGIVGRVILGTKTITNCVNTGIITSTYSGINPVYTAGICGGLVSQSAQTVTCEVLNCVNEGTITVESKMLAEGKYAGTVVGNTINTKTSNADTITLSNLYTTKYVNNENWIENPEYYKNSDEINALLDVLNSAESGVWEFDNNTARLELVWYTGSTTAQQ